MSSVLPLCWELDPPWNVKTDQAFFILKAGVDNQVYTGWGMTYEGISGYWLQVGEVLAVLIAAGLSLVRRNALRWTGHAILLAWAGLWLVNSVRFVILAPIWVFFLPLGFSIVFLAAVAARAMLAKRPAPVT